MRIVIAGPPKTGNVWLKCILSNAYGLKILGPKETPERPRVPLFREWVAAGGFPDGTIYHQHYDYSDELADALAAIPAHVVTIVRDPYDTFVSSYFTIQQHKDDGQRKGRRTDQLLDKPLDHPDVLEYLRQGGFRSNMVRAKAWMESGRTAVVRYEDLHGDPVGALERLTAQIAPVERTRLEQAVDACSAENMRKSNRTSKHVRAAKVGDSKERLNEDHLAIFREQHADLVRSLGYEVR
ncbi:MAG: sulfotransferase domain-containing protein [Chloroflexota bacterium]|nr:sulfotransferase domain-containing protein [Chloroflexota bacterium]